MRGNSIIVVQIVGSSSRLVTTHKCINAYNFSSTGYSESFSILDSEGLLLCVDEYFKVKQLGRVSCKDFQGNAKKYFSSNSWGY
jgi:hypothetical protein